MLLTIDVGNTNVLFGLYQGHHLIDHWRIKTGLERMPDEYGFMVLSFFQRGNYRPEAVRGICLASVVPPLTKIIVRMCERYFKRQPLVVDEMVETGLHLAVDQPEALGADRLAGAVAAWQLYGGPVCIADLGTATKFEAISREGHYLGGAILPGMAVSADALFTRAAKLPRVALIPPPRTIGTNTTHAIQSGLLYGYVSLIEGMVARFRKELGADMQVVATGGLAHTICQHTAADVIDHINPWLILEGLRLIWELNRG